MRDTSDNVGVFQMNSSHDAGSSDLRVLWHLLFKRVRGRSHADRLNCFYEGQARGYDSFRSRLLHGRRAMIDRVQIPDRGVWIDIGAGTGENAEYLAHRRTQLKSIYLVDLCRPLLQVAEERIASQGWRNTHAVLADGTRFVPPEEQVDVISFSYSLTMIPDWFRAIDHAWSMLKPGGQIAIVDFYVSRKHPDEGLRRHGWLTRNLVPLWFGNDNVQPSPDHLPYLRSRFETATLEEEKGTVPYAPLIRIPYYIFIGTKPVGSEVSRHEANQMALSTSGSLDFRRVQASHVENVSIASR